MSDPSRFSLTPVTPVPALIERYPQLESVLRRYGWPADKADEAPNISLRQFAQARDVDERALLDELRQAVVQSAAHPQSHDDSSSDVAQAIYRPFFLAGIVLVLTIGAGWGVWLLWRIGLSGDFQAPGVHEINAHGHAQIFGWVGLFIMGFALQVLPRFWQVKLPAPRLALGCFVAMVIAVTARSMAMAWPDENWALSVVLIGGSIELSAIVCVAGILVCAFCQSKTTVEPYIAFVLTGFGWFVVQATVSLWHTQALMTAPDREALLWQIATYQGPLRNLQIHGLALFMILGVSMRMLPAMFGVPRLSPRRGWWGYGLLVTAVVSEIALFIAFRWTESRALAGGLFGSWVLLALGVALVVWPWQLWRPLPTRDRSAKFVRAAYGWLAVGLGMLVLLPVYQLISGIAFSHAYYGAIRHAVTVGFVSMMIMGVAAKVVPTLTGRNQTEALPGLWAPFILVNTGCLLRVSMQTLTDWSPLFYPVIGISGTLELLGLALWGGHLAGLMLPGLRWRVRRSLPAGG
jgi:hypothetical protein